MRRKKEKEYLVPRFVTVTEGIVIFEYIVSPEAASFSVLRGPRAQKLLYCHLNMLQPKMLIE